LVYQSVVAAIISSTKFEKTIQVMDREETARIAAVSFFEVAKMNIVRINRCLLEYN
jgi:hypothetical protein